MAGRRQVRIRCHSARPAQRRSNVWRCHKIAIPSLSMRVGKRRPLQWTCTFGNLPNHQFLELPNMPRLPLSPMLVQYLVGLCCLKWDPGAVDVTIGEMVLDPAAGKQRDVDVTVTISDS